MPSFDVRPVPPSPDALAALRDLLIGTVANGGSVSFMHPLAPDQAEAFWNNAFAAAGRGERVILGAFDGDHLLGTVTLLLDCPPNQPHRAEIAKLMTRVDQRGRGIATALMAAAEALAVARNRTLLVLDTATEDGAAPFYSRLGYTRAGEIPDYAFKPLGGLTGTILFWKRLPVSDGTTAH
ncbi:MAG: GNAT family N-acetyltransferase [Alphaproteobacteria bacterium]|nr:GNAT family N-acetyltransferase [Alphaproteobacteria bacterium]MBU0796220.1 GNAT family N-acetyltransferase [Alphaproteobacteria bacterium]MBU0888432.1 GNAT family N-acetyltransferase [Alphaproteobacteria bacterium]MBU1813105.1 GNAT family N-acetyltransferase [Alphaproteobacteria bacterium]